MKPSPSGSRACNVFRQSIQRLFGDEEPFFSVSAQVDSLGWSAGGKALAIGCLDRKLIVWDAGSEKVRHEIYAHPKVAWSADGTRIASYCWLEPFICIWNAEEGTARHTFKVHPKMESVAWSPDGSTLAMTGCDDNCFWLVDAETGKVLSKSNRAHAGIFNCVIWSPDGKTLATGHEHSFIMLWAASGGALCNLGRHDIGSRIVEVVFAPDGKTVSSSASDGTVRLWEADGEKPPLHVLRGK